LFFNEFAPLEFNIDEILDLNKKDTFFVSDWNKTEKLIDFPNNYLNPIKNNLVINKNRYYFSDEFQEEKYKFKNSIFKFYNKNINLNNFCILNNGTSGLFIIFLILKNLNNDKALVFTPTYFTHINVFNNIGIKCNFFNVNLVRTGMDIDFNRLENYIIKENINLLVVTDPLFGIGLSIGKENYEILISICKKYNIWIVIDYLYGGMEWDSDNHIFNECFFSFFEKYEKMVLVESISKRLFLNGMKWCIIYANNEIIQNIENLSVSFLGSLTCIQISLFHELYSMKNIKEINEIIHKNIINIKLCYEQIQAMLIGTDYFLSNSNSGYFTLMGIPYYRLNNTKGIKAAEFLAHKVKIITIPHERYGFILDDFYTFRVNLSLKKDELYYNISKML